MQTIEEIRMQGDHITNRSFGELADDLMTELAAHGLHGMSKAQADMVVRMGKLLDWAARRLNADGAVGELADNAARLALAMRMHGATLRGAAGAALLEDMVDALGGRYEPDSAEQEEQKADPELSVDEAMKMLNLGTQADLARKLGIKPETITQWKARGGIPEKSIKMIRRLYRGMQVAA